MSILVTVLSIALMMSYLAVPAALVWLPIYVGSRLNGAGIVQAYLCVLAAAVALLAAHWQDVKETCGFSQSDCLGAQGFFMAVLVLFGAFAVFGGISALLNRAKWRKTRIGVA